MHALFITGSRQPIDTALRLQHITDWTIDVAGNQLPFPEATQALVRLGGFPINHYNGIVLIGVAGAVPMTIFTVARMLVLREYTGKLIAVAKPDDLPRFPSEARQFFRNAGIRNDQFVPTLDDEIRELKR